MTCRCLGWISQLEQRTEGTSATGVEVLAGEGVGGGLRGGRRGVTPLLKAVVGLYLPVGSGGVG